MPGQLPSEDPAGRGDRSLHRQTQLQLASTSILARRSLGIILSFFAKDVLKKKLFFKEVRNLQCLNLDPKAISEAIAFHV